MICAFRHAFDVKKIISECSTVVIDAFRTPSITNNHSLSFSPKKKGGTALGPPGGPVGRFLLWTHVSALNPTPEIDTCSFVDVYV